MNIFVPDNILEDSTCSKCYKYLTVFPIEFNGSGESICGRCLDQSGINNTSLFLISKQVSERDIFQNIIPHPLLAYATMAESLFPCINRYEGCRELIPAKFIRKHESHCESFKHNCPICSFQGVGSQLLRHFQLFHKKLCLWENFTVFILNNDWSNYYLYKSHNELFMVYVEYVKHLEQFTFSTKYLGIAPEQVKRIRIEFQMQQENGFVIVSSPIYFSNKENFILSFKIGEGSLKKRDSLYCKYEIIV